MYLPLYQVGKQSAHTDGYIYPCPSLATEKSPAFIEYENEPVVQTKEMFPVINKSVVPTHTPVTNKSVVPTHTPESSSRLLPVLDCRFNLREICKQSVLLEDHLTHEEKRCTDCCIKHFLALEGLCEEAITLDKTGETMYKYQDLPKKIREIQNLWVQSPQGNAHKCSQLLREIRKEFQPDVFPIIFDQNQPLSNNCTSSSCRIQK